jgi:mannose-6-phosphate isomerase-like protein (cupin superfamily)
MAWDAWTTTAAGAAFDVDAVMRERESLGVLYHQFLKVPGLRMGIYRLSAGSTDPQSPHTEDEAYYVLAGRAKFEVNREVFDVRPGSILYVEAQAAHKFFDIVEDLTLLVFFASDKRARQA